jgi:hypothetical protein
MAFNLTQFISTINHKGITYKSDFEVQITPPLRMKDAGIGSQELSFRANRVDLPGRSLQTVSNRNAVGPERQIVYNGSHIPVSMSIIGDSSMNVKRFIEEWQDLAIGVYRTNANWWNASKYNLRYYDDYAKNTSMTITQFDRNIGRPVYKCRLIECYPITLNPIDLDWDSSLINEINVAWAYRYYQIVENNAFTGP